MKSPTKDAQPRSLHAVVGRKALVHGIANCLDCDWQCMNYCTVQRSARRHTEQTGHKVSMELGYAVTISGTGRNTQNAQ